MLSCPATYCNVKGSVCSLAGASGQSERPRLPSRLPDTVLPSQCSRGDPLAIIKSPQIRMIAFGLIHRDGRDVHAQPPRNTLCRARTRALSRFIREVLGLSLDELFNGSLSCGSCGSLSLQMTATHFDRSCDNGPCCHFPSDSRSEIHASCQEEHAENSCTSGGFRARSIGDGEHAGELYAVQPG
ncbi:MAG: hypothetical protein QOE55_4623 [Acidobacteriaceae bacterium]|nr:hypothetical protein [Acidobacteriaceae bacterium]